MRHPVLGVGIGNFLLIYREIVTERPDLSIGYLQFGAHNAYFALAAEIGVIGAVAFFILTLTYATKGLYIATRDGVPNDIKYTALGLSVGLIGFVANTFTSNTFQHPQPALFFWILSGMVAGLGAGLWQADIRPQPSKPLEGDGLVRGSALASWVSRVRFASDTFWRRSFVFSRRRGTQAGARQLVRLKRLHALRLRHGRLRRIRERLSRVGHGRPAMSGWGFACASR